MKNKQKGFSLIELLLVVVMIGIIAAIAIPSLIKSVAAAENASTVATMKTIQLAESSIYAQRSRYGYLSEVNQFQNNLLGQVQNNKLTRGKFIYEMIPANPTDNDLKSSYQIKASRVNFSQGALPYVIQMNDRGIISPIF